MTDDEQTWAALGRLVAWPVAVGNYRDGYRGVIRVAPSVDHADALTLAECSHRHPATDEARDCAWARIESA